MTLVGQTSVSHRSNGFSLIELLVVVVLVAIIAAVAAPSFRSTVESFRVRNAAADLHTAILSARSEALKRNGDVTLTQAAGGWQNGWTMTAQGGAVIRTHAPLKGVVITAGANAIVYTRSGHLPVLAAQPSFTVDISATATDKARCLTIELSGMPRSHMGACP